ncbi:uncharacterized protein TNCV_2248071 [Trichonephila clavipes]|nr:uncharacterized protein TNCV_2248071 [Trichonephila clavipes]
MKSRSCGFNKTAQHVTIDLLKNTFVDRLISRFGPVNWSPRSCDLTPLHYFLWGYVKSLVYADKPQTRDHLEDNIHRVFADIRPQMLEKFIERWTSRLDCIRASRSSPMQEIIFKIRHLQGYPAQNALDKDVVEKTIKSRAICLIGCFPDMRSTFTTCPCVLKKRPKAPG